MRDDREVRALLEGLIERAAGYEAQATYDWVLIDMKEDWNRVFAP